MQSEVYGREFFVFGVKVALQELTAKCKNEPWSGYFCVQGESFSFVHHDSGILDPTFLF
jgi:hypothetical protein